MLKKRKLNEVLGGKLWGSIPGRMIDEWVLHRSNIYESQESKYTLKRFKSTPIQCESFTLNYFNRKTER